MIRFDSSPNTLIFISWLVFFLTYWIIGLSFLVVDIFHVPNFIWSLKFQKKRWFKVEGSPFNPSLAKTVANALMNQILVFLPGFFLLHFVSQALGFGLKMERELPPLSEVAYSAVAIVACVEVGFYYSHRLLHVKSLYFFHKPHHTFVTPIALSAIYSHPVEAFISSVCCIVGPAFFLRTHLSLFYFGMFVGWAVTCRSHSGYGGIDNRIAHDLHHSKNNGNFGLTGVLDYLHGTIIKIQD